MRSTESNSESKDNTFQFCEDVKQTNFLTEETKSILR